MWDLSSVAVPVAVAGGGLAVVWAALERWYVPIPPNRALVLFGRRAVRTGERDTSRAGSSVAREPRILIGGGTYLAPWNRATAFLSLAPLDVEATVRALHALDGAVAEGWEVVLQVQVKVPAEPQALRTAAENLLGLTEEELRSYVRRTVEGAVPTVLARLRPRDGEPDWERLASEIQATVAPELVTAGLLVRAVSVRELHRIAPATRSDRALEARRRPGLPVATPDGAVRPEETNPRLVRVELGLRAIAADLARLLRDEPGRPAETGRWSEVGLPVPIDDRSHDSMADGPTPGTVRPPWRAGPDPEASP